MDMDKRKATGLLWVDTNDFKSEQLAQKEFLYDFNHLRPSQAGKKAGLMKKMFAKVGEMVWIEQPLSFAVGNNTEIGERVYINSGLTLVDDWKIKIGNDVLIAPNVTIVTTNHPLHRELRPKGEMFCLPVEIKDWAWIGSNVTILPGVTIGEGAVIGAGSVVTKDIPANVVAVGNPCKVLREITDKDKEYYHQDRKVDDEWLNR